VRRYQLNLTFFIELDIKAIAVIGFIADQAIFDDGLDANTLQVVENSLYGVDAVGEP